MNAAGSAARQTRMPPNQKPLSQVKQMMLGMVRKESTKTFVQLSFDIMSLMRLSYFRQTMLYPRVCSLWAIMRSIPKRAFVLNS